MRNTPVITELTPKFYIKWISKRKTCEKLIQEAPARTVTLRAATKLFEPARLLNR